MLSAKKPNTLPNRHSLALDDRSSQILSAPEQSTRNSSFSGSGSEEEKPDLDDNKKDHLSQFETNEFPPEPPLDASRTSLVSHEDQSENDQNETGHSTSDQPTASTADEEQSVATTGRSVNFENHYMLLAIIGLLVLMVAVFLELKYSFIRKN